MIELIGLAVLLLGTAAKTENITCSSNCMPDPDNSTEACNTTSGVCLYGCNEGFVGQNCTVECPSGCALPSQNNSEICNSTTLECFFGCKQNFAGSTCSFECPDMCELSTDPKADMCNSSTGECLYGCRHGYTGENCSLPCPSNCGIANELYTQTCNETTEECMYGCLQGYGGSNCSTICNSMCLIPASNDSETCDTSGNCKLGCISGFGGPNCSYNCSLGCSTPENSTETCNATTGECLHGCNDGYADIDCSFECPDNCIAFKSETCNYTNGECLNGCIKGFAGPNCTNECPENCTYPSEDGEETCTVDGECLNGCNKGYSGPNCSNPCPENCTLPTNDGEETCNFTNGECLLGCINGTTGPNCSVDCPENCLFPSVNESGTCNFTSGECLHGCNYGFVGSNCSIPCPQNCSSGDRGEDMCEPSTGECLFGCDDGFYGPNCTQLCKSHDELKHCKRCSMSGDNSDVICNECIKNFYQDNGGCLACNYFCKVPGGLTAAVCRETDGYCNHGCKDGRFGTKCGRPCSNLCQDTCDRNTGNCDIGCKHNSYCGPTCERICQDGCLSQHCNQTCDCVKGCTSTHWGEKCSTACNRNCVKPSDSLTRVCKADDGTCLLGCVGKLHWGNQCDKKCSSNCGNGTCEQMSGNCTDGCTTDTVYDWPCDKTCNENCINGVCERADGYCKEGCKVGKYGTKCDLPCNKNCFDSSCHRENGSCTVSCVNGFYGDICQTVCSDKCFDKKCERESGNCTDGCVSGYGGYHCLTVIGIKQPSSLELLGNNWIYVAIGCGALVLIGFMVMIVLITKKRRQIAKRRRTARMSTIPDEKVLEESQRRHKQKTEGAGGRLTQLFVENPLARFMKYRSHAGDLITKVPITSILKRVIQMEESDFSLEFDELKAELTKSHEASRRLDNLALNLYNGIYPYDENRVVLKHSFDDEVVTKRKSKVLRGILKSVHFGNTFRDSNYTTMSFDSDDDKNKHQKRTDVSKKNKGQDKPKGYSSVIFNIQNETAHMVQPKTNDERNSDDYAKVNIGNNKRSTDDDGPSDYAKVSTSTADNLDGIRGDDPYDHTTSFQNMKAGTSSSTDGSSDYAFVDKGIVDPDENVNTEKNGKEENDKDENDEEENDKYNYAVVHKDRISIVSDKDDNNEKKNAVSTANDYINASLIKGYNQNDKYIAAQAPSKRTVNDFWTMAWEQKSNFIIMLIEITGHTRCERYWPDEGKQETYGEITVSCYDTKHYADYDIRYLRLSLKNGHEREIVHLQFTGWPDEGCPVSAIEFIQFHQKYRSLTKGRLGAGPTIVHCTAGVGRTGVFIALDRLVEEGLDSLNVDVYKCVTALRDQRVLMVHSIDQYIFLYKAVAQTFALEVQPCHKIRLQDKLTELKKFDHDSGKTKLELLHQNLKASLVLDTAEIGPVDAVQERRHKDRPTSDVPDVLFRADLPNNIYINAVIYDSLRKKEDIVATQMPTPETLQDFCQLIVYHQCATVIMLNPFDPNDKSLGVYWPSGKTPVVAGKMIVSQLDIEKESDYIVRQLRIHSPDTGEDTPANEATMIQYKAWKIVKNVPNAKNIMKFLQLCQRHIKASQNGRVLVHCLNGAEQSGMFCALLNLYEYVENEDELSVPSVVRKIQARRPNAIPTTEQFEMCFAATCEYIKKT